MVASFRLTGLYITAAVVMVGIYVGGATAYDPIADDKVTLTAVETRHSNVAAAPGRQALFMRQANTPAASLVAVAADNAQLDHVVDVAIGMPRRLMQWGRRGSMAHAMANQMYWNTRGFGGPTIPSAPRMETATERRFAVVGA